MLDRGVRPPNLQHGAAPVAGGTLGTYNKRGRRMEVLVRRRLHFILGSV
jgi:hypothetical protein